MASTQITQTLQVFTDLTGQPLDAGYIYVGQVNQNPETSPIAVYWDAELTQPAAQPLRTVSGYISRQGAPASIYAASSYSITVKTKTGELVYYKSNVVTVLPDASVTTDMLVDGSVTNAKLAAPVNALINGALQKAGGTMTGTLTLSGNATSALHAVPKQQLDAATRAGIGSLTVTVASNALTGTLAAETLDFRSATLNNGTPVARTALAAASLTVPSGATLGTTNGVQARIVWGWLDNAGTLEPFVCNTAGGINLDETTLINTTAISASSNSASVIYSQTARTGVAFRVRGFCDITEATAGIWATDPTLVQGVGGQATNIVGQTFASSQSTNGWQKLPSGLIIQWGISASFSDDQRITTTFPITFPNNCFVVVPASGASALGRSSFAEVHSISWNTSSVVFENLGNDGISTQARWIAIGN